MSVAQASKHKLAREKRNMMHVQLLIELSDLERIAAAWMELYRAYGRTPFQNPDLHLIWWRHLGLREGWSPLVAIGFENSQLVAVASLAVRRSKLLRILEWAGMAAFDYPDMLLAKGIDAAPLWKALQNSGHYDIARLRCVRSDAVGRPSLLGFARKLGKDHSIYAIDLMHRNGQAWLDSLPKSIQAHHRRRFRQLATLGPVTMRRATQPEEIADAVKTVVRFKAEWSRSQDIDSVYLHDGIEAYFHDFAMAASRDQTLHLTTLDCGGQSLAAHLGFVSRDGFYYYLPSYDIAFAKLSPGRVHTNLMVMWAIDNGLHRFDFLRGEADYKTQLGSISRQLEDYTFSQGLFGTAALQVYLWQRNRRAVVPDQHSEKPSVDAMPSPALKVSS
jgi:CelD/BcsL family acetyltransferase involved in cellulose biosynthesis